jgi:hypothetical protein
MRLHLGSARESSIMNTLRLSAQNNNGDAAGAIIGLLCMVFAGLLGLAALAFWVWTLVDAIKNPSLNDNERIIWIIVILLLSWLGSILYLVIGRKGA